MKMYRYKITNLKKFLVEWNYPGFLLTGKDGWWRGGALLEEEGSSVGVSPPASGTMLPGWGYWNKAEFFSLVLPLKQYCSRYGLCWLPAGGIQKWRVSFLETESVWQSDFISVESNNKFWLVFIFWKFHPPCPPVWLSWIEKMIIKVSICKR